MSEPPNGRRLVEPSKMRAAIARRMSASKREAPHFYVSAELELDAALAELDRLNREREPDSRVSLTALFVRATALSLERHPALNAVWTEEGLAVMESINVGVAVALDDGLVAPALLACGSLNLAQTADALADLTRRARLEKLRGAEMTEATFTLSNLGMFDVSAFSAIITPPQVAILALGTTMRVPRFDGDRVVARSISTATVSADHRAVDGVDVARFLSTLKNHLEHPAEL